MRTRTNAGQAALWGLSVLLAFVFVMAGVPKLTGAEAHVRHFERWGYPDWFRLVVGLVEVGSAALLLVPRFASAGAAGIVVIMAGATYTHLVRAPAEAGRAPFTLTLLALALLVGYLRRPRAHPKV
jgi:putative oxidoreductase